MSKSRTASWAGCVWVAFLLSGACASNDEPSADEVEVRSALSSVSFTLPVLVGENPSDVAVATGSTVSINDRGALTEATTGDAALLSNLGGGVAPTSVATALGVGATTGTILSVPLVFLRAGSQVRGSLYQGVNQPVQKQTNTTVSGVEQVGVAGFAADATWTRTIVWPTTFNASPNLEPGQLPTVVALAPGAYHSLDVKSGRTLLLRAGLYYFDGLVVESGGGLQIDGSAGPVFAFILDAGLIFRGTMPIGVATPGMPLSLPSFTVMTTGSVDIEKPFTGVVIAPNGSIDLKGPTRGAFFGKSLTLYENEGLSHYRDPFSFRGFAPSDGTTFVDDRTSVTGGGIRLPGRDSTDEAYQNETVAAVSRNGSNYVVTVGFNDETTAPTNPTIIYPDGRGSVATIDGGLTGGQDRTIFPGASILGWSFSTDGGRTFNYGGRVVAPAGTIIWSDPAMAKLGLDDPNVYYAQIAGSLAPGSTIMTNGIDPNTHEPNVGPLVGALNGYCIARSTDRGISFPSVACVKDGFQDGTALAVAQDANGRRQVYVGGQNRTGLPGSTRIWRMDGESMSFATAPLADPMPQGLSTHPRMRVFSGFLYVVGLSNAKIFANRLNIAGGATTWQGASLLASDAELSDFTIEAPLPGAVDVAGGPPFSFDIGPDASGASKLRLIYETPDTTVTGGATALKVIDCDPNLDPSTCTAPGWSTLGEIGTEGNPSIRFSNGQWVANWRKRDPMTPVSELRSVVARLETGVVPRLNEKNLSQAVVPCTYGGQSGRWGEYDQIDGFGDSRFFVSYAVGGPGCRWQGLWTSDTHVWGSVVSF